MSNPMNERRWQFRLSTALWFTTIFCLFAAWWVDRTVLSHELTVLREQYTHLLWNAPIPMNAVITAERDLETIAS